MVKSSFIALLVLCLFSGAYTACGQSVTVAECILAHASGEVGVREETGKNDGDRVETYLRHVGLKAGHPWCAAFVSYVVSTCGVVNPMSGYSPLWFRSNVVYRRGKSALKDLSSIHPGDVFGIWFSNMGRIAHVGIIERISGGYALTIEGNTNGAGSREGDGVYRKRRLVRQIYAVSRWETATP